MKSEIKGRSSIYGQLGVAIVRECAYIRFMTARSQLFLEFESAHLPWARILTACAAYKIRPSPKLLGIVASALISVPLAVANKRKSYAPSLITEFYLCLGSAIRRFKPEKCRTMRSQFSYFGYQLECWLKDHGYDEDVIPRPYRLRIGAVKSPKLCLTPSLGRPTCCPEIATLAKEGIFYDTGHTISLDDKETSRYASSVEDPRWGVVLAVKTGKQDSAGRRNVEARARLYCDIAGETERAGNADLHDKDRLRGCGSGKTEFDLDKTRSQYRNRIRLGKCTLTSRSKPVLEICPDSECASDGFSDRYLGIDGAIPR